MMGAQGVGKAALLSQFRTSECINAYESGRGTFIVLSILFLPIHTQFSVFVSYKFLLCTYIPFYVVHSNELVAKTKTAEKNISVS